MVYRPTWSRLKEYRLKAGIPQWRVANQIGIAETALSKYETGAWKLPREIAEKLAELYNVPVEELTENTPAHSGRGR